MLVEIQRTSEDRMVDMYIVRFLPIRTRFVCFRKLDFETKYPQIHLNRGEKIICKMGLTEEENGV